MSDDKAGWFNRGRDAGGNYIVEPFYYHLFRVTFWAIVTFGIVDVIKWCVSFAQ